jgi:glucose 1-dehydrogenase
MAKRTVLITGGAQGIGLACAERFIKDDCNVYIVDINASEGRKALAHLKSDSAHFIEGDVSDPKSVTSFIDTIESEAGPIHVLVNNAAIIVSGDFLELDYKDFERVLHINLGGYFLVGQAVAKQMVKHNVSGAIINMSSINAILAIPNQIPYVTAKGGIAQLTKVMALALADKNIRVNAIGPGSIMTEMLKGVMENKAAKKKILSRTPMKRLGEPHEIASIAAFLASDDASYITGETIYADGGRLSLNYTVPVD